MIKKAFTILEMLLILAILSVLILMSRSLFVNQNQDIIQSEICINTISTSIEGFFNNAILGKIYNNTPADQYNIDVTMSPKLGFNNIAGYIIPVGSVTSSIIFKHERGHVAGNDDCNNKKYIVLLSGSLQPLQTDSLPRWGTINISNNKEVNICYAGIYTNGRCEGPEVTPGGKQKFLQIDYLVCPKVNNIAQLDRCTHTYSNRIDTATRSVKSNRCLGINRTNNTCNKRSMDKF